MRSIRSKLTYANVMATIAVFIALGSGAYAATHLAKNSVGTKQLKKNAVKGGKVKDASLTGADINATTLGTVPNATHSTSSNQLGGSPASAFVKGASGIPGGDLKGTYASPTIAPNAITPDKVSGTLIPQVGSQAFGIDLTNAFKDIDSSAFPAPTGNLGLYAFTSADIYTTSAPAANEEVDCQLVEHDASGDHVMSEGFTDYHFSFEDHELTLVGRMLVAPSTGPYTVRMRCADLAASPVLRVNGEQLTSFALPVGG
jgi:hypothetical protein